MSLVQSIQEAQTHMDVSINIKIFFENEGPLKDYDFSMVSMAGNILAKYDLAMCNCHECKQCCFCGDCETIKHLFFEYNFSHTTWSIIEVSSNLHPIVFLIC